jgi:hypothetical protein
MGGMMKQARDGSTQLTAVLHGVRLTLCSERDDFLAFARAYLAPLMDNVVELEDESTSPHIHVQMTWAAHPPMKTISESHDGMEQLGRRLWAGSERLRFTEIWQLPGLALDVTWHDEMLTVQAAYTWPSRRARWLASLLPAARERLFVGLIYYLVYFPWAWWLERERGWTLLHAAAVAAPAGAGIFGPQDGVIFSGLPGCGKSTTALAFLNQPEWQIVSDNLVFTDGQQVFACVEPIHVDERTRVLVGDGDNMSERVCSTGRRFSHGRQDYEVSAAARSPSATPRALGFLHVGRETVVRRLDSGDSARRLLANDLLAKEWLAYQESAAAMHLVWPNVGDQERRRANLLALAQSMPCYDVTTARGGNVSRAVSTILRAMETDI